MPTRSQKSHRPRAVPFSLGMYESVYNFTRLAHRMDTELVGALNLYLATEDGTMITTDSSFYKNTLLDSLMLHNTSQAELLVQAFIGRFLHRSGEKLVVSLANHKMRRREMYQEVKHAFLEMMLVVALTTLAFVLLRKQ